jgi:quercetin dioxygenase-like cupin family protein
MSMQVRFIVTEHKPKLKKSEFGIMPVLKHREHTPSEVKPGVTRSMLYTEKLHMAVIDFSDGPWNKPDPYHNHVHDQVTYVAEGELIFFCEDEPEQRLCAGDIFSVPSNKKHTIQLLSKTARLIDSFTPLRQDFLNP